MTIASPSPSPRPARSPRLLVAAALIVAPAVLGCGQDTAPEFVEPPHPDATPPTAEELEGMVLRGDPGGGDAETKTLDPSGM